LTFKSETEKVIYTICGLWEKVKKSGLEKEMLGKLGDLTPGRTRIHAQGKLLKL